MNAKLPVPVHDCAINWHKSPNEMEADIISEGFQKSRETEGLTYNVLIGKNLFIFISLSLRHLKNGSKS